MSAIQTKLMTYKGYGKCIQMNNGIIEVIATLEFGPRIIRFGFVGGKNILYESTDYVEPKQNDLWHIIGGHRLWHSPEKYPRTWLSDWEAVNHSVLEDTLVLAQKAEEWVQVEKEIHVKFRDDSSLELRHVIRNKNAWTINVSAWAITAVIPGGVLVVKQPGRRDDFAYGFDGGMIVSLWPYSNMNDIRVQWGDKFITLKQDITNKKSFKFGLNNVYGWAAYLVDHLLFVKNYNHEEDGNYPDGGVSFESYTDNKMLEMETLSPLIDLAPDSVVIHKETWSLYESSDTIPTNEDELETLLKSFLT